MSYRTIFTPVVHEAGLEAQTTTACTLATAFCGHVRAGYFSLTPTPQVGLAIDGGVAVAAMPYMDAARALNAEAAQKARHHFIALAGIRSLDVEPYGHTVTGRPTTSWREAEVETLGRFAAEARTADLCVSPSLQDKAEGLPRRVFEVMAETGTPVLISTAEGMAELPRRAIIAWDGEDEAASALRAAIPLLTKSYSVHIVTAGELPAYAARPDAARSFLERHGVKADVRTVGKSPRAWDSVRDAIALDRADLLVMGAYSTPRMAEMVFGGFTRSALSEAPCSVMIAT